MIGSQSDLEEIATSGLQKHCTCRQLRENGHSGATGRSNRLLRSPWALKIIASGADGRSNRLLWSHWAFKLAAPEPLGAQICCSGATGRSNWLLRSHWALKSVVLEPLGSVLLHAVYVCCQNMNSCKPTVCVVPCSSFLTYCSSCSYSFPPCCSVFLYAVHVCCQI